MTRERRNKRSMRKDFVEIFAYLVHFDRSVVFFIALRPQWNRIFFRISFDEEEIKKEED